MRWCIAVVMIVCAAASGPGAREVVGAADVSGTELDLGVQQGKKYLAVGVLYGGSPIGLDFEYAFNRAVGGRFGLGLGGVEAGLNFHLTSDMRKDLFFATTLAYLPALDHLVTPILGFGMRWYWGPNARTGLAVEIGSGYNFVDRSPEFFDGELDVAKNTVLPRIALGAVFKLR